MQAGDERGTSNPAGPVAVVAPFAEPLSPPTPPSMPAQELPPVQTADVPTLPSDTMVTPSLTVPEPQLAHALHQPSQAGRANIASWSDQLPVVATKRAPRRQIDATSARQSIALTVVMTIVGLVFGASLHVGYQRWQTSPGTGAVPAAPSVDVVDLSTWPQIDPPAIRFVDTITVVRSAGGTRTTSEHRDLSTGNRIVSVVETDSAGATNNVDVEVRGETASLRSGADPTSTPITPTEAESIVGPQTVADVLTVSDVFPVESLAYVTLLDGVARSLEVVPLRPATPGSVVANPTDLPTSGVLQYRVIVDVEAFRSAQGLAFQNWERRLGRAAVPRLEAWVDASGVVRQVAFEVDGVEVTHTLVDGSATSTRLEVDPIADDAATEPTVAPDEVGS